MIQTWLNKHCIYLYSMYLEQFLNCYGNHIGFFLCFHWPGVTLKACVEWSHSPGLVHQGFHDSYPWIRMDPIQMPSLVWWRFQRHNLDRRPGWMPMQYGSGSHRLWQVPDGSILLPRQPGSSELWHTPGRPSLCSVCGRYVRFYFNLLVLCVCRL